MAQPNRSTSFVVVVVVVAAAAVVVAVASLDDIAVAVQNYVSCSFSIDYLQQPPPSICSPFSPCVHPP